MVKAVSKKELEGFWELSRPTTEEMGVGVGRRPPKQKTVGLVMVTLCAMLRYLNLYSVHEREQLKILLRRITRKDFQRKRSLSSADQQQIWARERKTDGVIILDYKC